MVNELCLIALCEAIMKLDLALWNLYVGLWTLNVGYLGKY